tara:strand:- start:710 stop:2428 length:1719 start_codon:yes stop_codon:yes gene_type:complete
MELAIPVVAVAGLLFSNTSREGYSSNQTQPSSYPDANSDENNRLSVNNYPNSNQATDKYYKQNVYRNKVINSKATNNRIRSLTGDVVESKNFKHNNMQPYFGAKIRGRTVDENSNEAILDNMVGTGSQIKNKTERAPLFKPQNGLQYANGAPNMSDFYKSRVNPSNRMANVKPWEETKVAPGLNLGFDGKPNHGLNNGMMAREHFKPKDVDELRTKNNPKLTFELNNLEGPAVSYVKNTGIQAKVEKNRPDTYFENNKNKWFTTTGLEKAPTNRSTIIERDVNRNEHETLYNGGGGNNKGGYTVSEYSQGFRKENTNDYKGPVSMIGTSSASNSDYGRVALNIERNNRVVNEQPSMFGNIKSAVDAAILPIVDLLKPTKKEDLIENKYRGNISVSNNKNIIYNPNDKLKITNREMDTNKELNLNIQNQNQPGYVVSKPQIYDNQRTTTNVSYVGTSGGSGVSNAAQSYESAYNQTNNPYKEATAFNRTNQGNAKQFSYEQNINIGKIENDRKNNRMFVPSNSAMHMPPSTQNYGHMDKPYQNNPNVNMDRMQPNLLDAFKKNPYTHSLNSTA